MCNDFQETHRKRVTGYKVVAQNLETKKFHSVLTGFEYPDEKELIPNWLHQRNAIALDFFWEYILPGSMDRYEDLVRRGTQSRSGGWRYKMIGRTNVFVKEEGATKLKHHIIENSSGIKLGFEIVVVKARISRKLLESRYSIQKGTGSKYKEFKTFCGEKIKFIEVVE